MAIRLAFGGQFAFNHHLGGDTGVVGADLPQGFFTQHAVIAGEGILNGVLERMAHVQGAGDVRRRNHNGVAFAIQAILIGLEVAFFFPLLVPGLFEGVGLVGLVHGDGVISMVTQRAISADLASD